MYWRIGIALMLSALAFGIWIASLQPGTGREEFFWRCMASNDHIFRRIWPQFLWLTIPSLLLAVWPFAISLPGVKSSFNKATQLQASFWLFLAFASIPRFFPWFAIVLPQLIAQVFADHFPQIYHHGTTFCAVCDHTLAEDLNMILLPCMQSILWAAGVATGVLQLLKSSKPVSRPNSAKSYLPVLSFACLSMAVVVADITQRYVWAEECIHQGFH